jgi:hypothetical protein
MERFHYKPKCNGAIAGEAIYQAVQPEDAPADFSTTPDDKQLGKPPSGL